MNEPPIMVWPSPWEQLPLLVGIGTGLLGILILLGAIRLSQLRKQTDKEVPPLWLFHRIAAGRGLSWRDQWLLYRIARAQKLPSALTLMLSLGTMDHHAMTWLGREPWFGSSSKRRLGRIRRTLYGAGR